MGAELGDARRTRRLLSIVRRVEQSPSAAFPRAVGSTSELEAFYRFTTNMKFAGEDILVPHFASSLDRARAHEEVEGRLCKPRSAIHVMDAASDMFELLQQLAETGTRFVIRVSYPNRVVKDAAGFRTHLQTLLAQAKPRRERRRVRLARRGENVPPKSSGAIRHAPRVLPRSRSPVPSSRWSSQSLLLRGQTPSSGCCSRPSL